MIEVRGLTKRYRNTLAVGDLSFSVGPGRVTGFLGPNGAGKSTTMRVILGLDRATSGEATINGRSYVDLHSPLREVGALLDAGAVHGGRSALGHLLGLARSNGLPRRRVDEVLSGRSASPPSTPAARSTRACSPSPADGGSSRPRQPSWPESCSS